jgi:hypothetical protein
MREIGLIKNSEVGNLERKTYFFKISVTIPGIIDRTRLVIPRTVWKVLGISTAATDGGLTTTGEGELAQDDDDSFIHVDELIAFINSHKRAAITDITVETINELMQESEKQSNPNVILIGDENRN